MTSVSVTVHVADLGKAAKLLEAKDGWEYISREAMVSALVTSPLLPAVYTRTPKSLMQRYALRSGQALKYRRGSATLDRRVWAKGRSADTIRRLQSYGLQNLARSILPWGGNATAVRLRRMAHRTSYGCSLTLFSDLPYARRMHDSRSTVYWSGRPYGRGWSTKGTGGGYISGPVSQYGGSVAEHYTKALARGIRGLGQ